MAYDLVARLKLEDRFSSPIRRAAGELKQFADQTAKASRAAHQMGENIRGGFGILDKTIGSVTLGQVGLAGAVAGVGYALKDSASKAMAFEAQMSTIKALTGMTGGEMTQLQSLVMKLGQDTKYSALEVAQGAEEMLKAGMSMSQLRSGALEAGLNLATAGGLDLAEASEIMSTALNTFKRDGMKAADAANLLAGAANASATSVHEMKYALSSVGVVAAGVHMPFKDASTAMALFAQNGLKGSDAGTSLKTMLANLSPRTKGATKAFEELGLITKDGTNKLFNAKDEIKDLASVAGELQKAMKKLNPKQQGEYLYEMFGSDAIRAGTILVKEGAEGVKKMYQEMSKVTALQVAKEKMNNAAGAVEQLSGAIETMQISALLPTMPLIKDFANGFSELVTDATPAITAFTTQLSNGAKGFFNSLKSDKEFQKLGWGDKLIYAMDKASDEFGAYMAGPGGDKLTAAMSSVTKVGTVAGVAIGKGMISGAGAYFKENPAGAAIAGMMVGLAAPGGPLVKTFAAAGLAAAGAMMSYISQTIDAALKQIERVKLAISNFQTTDYGSAMGKVIEHEKKIKSGAIPANTPLYKSGSMTAYVKKPEAHPKSGLQRISEWWNTSVEPKLPPGLRSHYSGLDYVPYDGYGARLHKGERVLTASENKEYSGGKSVDVHFNGDIHINGVQNMEEAADQLLTHMFKKLHLAGVNMA